MYQFDRAPKILRSSQDIFADNYIGHERPALFGSDRGWPGLLALDALCRSWPRLPHLLGVFSRLEESAQKTIAACLVR
jgi:hypothetical protein